MGNRIEAGITAGKDLIEAVSPGAIEKAAAFMSDAGAASIRATAKALGVDHLPSVEMAASKLDSLKGPFDQIQRLSGDTAPGLTQEQYLARISSGDIQGLDVRVKKLEDKSGYLINQQLIDNRQAGAVGKIENYVPGHGGDVWSVRHSDGTVAPYTIASELEPAVLKPSVPKNEVYAISLKDERPLENLKVGDNLQSGMGVVNNTWESPHGFKEGRHPWEGHVNIKHAETGSGWGVPGGMLRDMDGLKLMRDGKITDIDPTEVKAGDQLLIRNSRDLDEGVYDVTNATGFRNNSESIFGDLRVKSIDADGARLEMVKPLSGGPGVGDVYKVPLSGLKEPFFTRLDSFSPKLGDEVVIPKGTSAPNVYDSVFKSDLQGQAWTVFGQNPKGFVLGKGDDMFLVPQNYFNTRTMFPMQKWLERSK